MGIKAQSTEKFIIMEIYFILSIPTLYKRHLVHLKFANEEHKFVRISSKRELPQINITLFVSLKICH